VSRRAITSYSVTCTICGATEEFAVFGPPGPVHCWDKFGRAVKKEADQVLVKAQAWTRQHEHGATARGLGEA